MKPLAASHALAALFVLAAGALAACSSKSSGSTATSGGGDDGGGTDGGAIDPGDGAGGGDTGPTSAITCGAAPFVHLGIVVHQITTGTGPATPVEGATLTSSLCPGVSAITGADGVVSADVTKDAPFFARLQATNYANTLIAEMKYGADTAGIDAPLPPSLFTALVPGFTTATPAIIVGVSQGGGTGACDAIDGVTLAVTDHPEAVITYFTNDAIPQKAPGNVTTVAGRAAITGLTVGAPVAITGTKAGCTVDFARAPYTGRAPLEAGALTLVPAYIH
jgi:hypothetical protein